MAISSSSRTHQLIAVCCASLKLLESWRLAQAYPSCILNSSLFLPDFLPMSNMQGVGLGSGASTELTGVADPLRLMARHELDPNGHTLSIQLHIYNRLSVGIKGFTIRC